MADNRPIQNFGADIVGAVIIAFIVLFVWPGALRHEYKYMPAQRMMIRIDRLNGNTWALDNGKYDRKVTGKELFKLGEKR